MTRRLVSGRAGAGGSVGVASVTSSDGSLTVTGTNNLDISLRALGSAPEETLVVSKESDFPAPVAGVVTLSGRYKLTGLVAIGDDTKFAGPDGGDVAIEGAAGVEGCGLTGNIAGAFLDGSITLQNVTVENIHASGEDFAIGDTTGRILHLRLVTSRGTSSGRLTAHAGGMEVFNFVQEGTQTGLVCAAAYGAIRFIGGFFLNVPASFVSVTFTATSSVAAFLGISANTYTTTSATQFGFALDDAMTTADAAILVSDNTTIGPGATLDESVGNINSDDQRIVAAGNLDVPDWLGIITAEFSDSVTPISFAPTGVITTFDVVPGENAGPTTTIVELSGARSFRLVFNSIQDYYIEYIGDRDGVNADLQWVLSHTKTSPATSRATEAKLVVDRAPITGTYTDIDGNQVSRRKFAVSGILGSDEGGVSTKVFFGDRFTFVLASVSSDLQDYLEIQINAETR